MMGRLGDRFVLVRELAPGGMARVFLGRDEVLNRPVAVKIVEPDPEDPEIGLRFRREGRAAARLSHPNIVRVYDAGEDELDGIGVSYIVMEYVPCGDLKDMIERNGPLPEAMLSRVGADVAAGLAHAHERGIVHRDVKPRNVLIDDRGSPKLADFGIARALDSTTSHNRAESYLGTAAYSSPEQLNGERVTAKSDVYSLGATLYHAAVGRQPFSGNSIEVANQHVSNTPAPPGEVGARIGEELEALILDCLAKDPSRRPDAARVREGLLRDGAVGVAAGQGRRSATGIRAGGFPGEETLSRLTESAKSGGALGGGRSRRTGGGRGASGPPDRTINLPTRTFRAGARQRTTLAVLVVALLIVLLAAAGAWTLLGQGDGNTNTGAQNAGDQQQGKAAGPQKETKQEPAQGAGGAEQKPAENANPSGGASQENQAPAPPLANAEQTVYDLYYEMSFNDVNGTWAMLSPGLQEEIGSPEQWEQQEDIYTFTYMEFTSYPVARAAGDTAEVTFVVRLDHTWGSESLSGTWVCVNVDGEWKLDSLENAQRTPV
jgi:eukaryotic-like serine/threonine-protein kinase